MVLDGRGSAPLSHLGAAAAITALRNAMRRWEAEIAACLDSSCNELAAVGWQAFAQLLYHVAASEQARLAERHGSACDHFEFTLTVAVMGRERVGWLAVGDSPLVAIRHDVAGLVTSLEDAAFANQTSFVSARPRGRLGLRGGVIPSEGLTALLAMSDGTASRFLDLRQQTPAPAVAELVAGVSGGRWDEPGLRAMLADTSWDIVTRDDRSIAMLALKSGFPESPLASGNATPAICQPPAPAKPATLAGTGSLRPAKRAAACLALGVALVLALILPRLSSGGGSGGTQSSGVASSHHPAEMPGPPMETNIRRGTPAPSSSAPSLLSLIHVGKKPPSPIITRPPCSTPPLSFPPPAPSSPPTPLISPCAPKANASEGFLPP